MIKKLISIPFGALSFVLIFPAMFLIFLYLFVVVLLIGITILPLVLFGWIFMILNEDSPKQIFYKRGTKPKPDAPKSENVK